MAIPGITTGSSFPKMDSLQLRDPNAATVLPDQANGTKGLAVAKDPSAASASVPELKLKQTSTASLVKNAVAKNDLGKAAKPKSGGVDWLAAFMKLLTGDTGGAATEAVSAAQNSSAAPATQGPQQPPGETLSRTAQFAKRLMTV